MSWFDNGVAILGGFWPHSGWSAGGRAKERKKKEKINRHGEVLGKASAYGHIGATLVATAIVADAPSRR